MADQLRLFWLTLYLGYGRDEGLMPAARSDPISQLFNGQLFVADVSVILLLGYLLHESYPWIIKGQNST
jgi:hypothetical protein